MVSMFEGVASGTPQCDIISQEDDTQCPLSSVVRLRTQCDDCGSRMLRFCCEGHHRGLNRGKVLCYHCKSEKLRIKVS